MEQTKNLIELNEYILVKIMDNLNVKSLTAITETCTTFNNLVIETDRLMKKINLHVEFSKDKRGSSCIKRNIGYIKSIMKSQRKYRNMTISYLAKDIAKNDNFMSLFFSFITKFGLDTQVLSLHFCYFLNNSNFKKFINCFKNIVTCKLIHVQIIANKNRNDQTVAYPNLEHLSVTSSSHLCRENFYASENLKTIKIELVSARRNSVNVATDIEKFLLKQKNLKSLTLSDYQGFFYGGTDVLKDVPFQLELLGFHDAYFANNKNAYNFFKTQTCLERVSLGLFNSLLTHQCNKFLVATLLHIFNNTKLRNVEFILGSYKFVTLDFLNGLNNKNVVVLKFVDNYDNVNSKIVEKLAKAFPNVESFIYRGRKFDELFEAIRSLKHLQRLIIRGELSTNHIDQVDVTSGKLTHLCCEFWKKDENMIENFLIRNPTIKKLVLQKLVLSNVFAEKILTALPVLEYLDVNGLEDGFVISRFKDFPHFERLGFSDGMLKAFDGDDE